jgi:serine/threonine protein kinase
MAPEILQGKGVRRKADIWSFGCTLIEMAVAGNPWGEQLFDNNIQAMHIVVNPNKMPQIPNELSSQCKDFIKRCLTRDYEERPSAIELS